MFAAGKPPRLGIPVYSVYKRCSTPKVSPEPEIVTPKRNDKHPQPFIKASACTPRSGRGDRCDNLTKRQECISYSNLTNNTRKAKIRGCPEGNTRQTFCDLLFRFDPGTIIIKCCVTSLSNQIVLELSFCIAMVSSHLKPHHGSVR